jgi:hypothetical protein
VVSLQRAFLLPALRNRRRLRQRAVRTQQRRGRGRGSRPCTAAIDSHKVCGCAWNGREAGRWGGVLQAVVDAGVCSRGERSLRGGAEKAGMR